MKTKLSSKGQLVLPAAVRNRYGLKTGHSFEILMKEGQITLVPEKPKKRKGRIVKDPITGLPCLTFGPGAPKITTEMVDKLMEDFP